MIMEERLIDKYLKVLAVYVNKLDNEYESAEKLYNVDKFLRKNFPYIEADVYGSLVQLATARCSERGEKINEDKPFESIAIECYELLKFLEPNTSITLENLKEAFFTCSLANKNEVMKKYDRYKDALKLLNTLKQLFYRHQFRKLENNRFAIEAAKERRDKFRNLYKFLTTGELDSELQNVDYYYIMEANMTEEEWLVIYSYILSMQIKSYKKIEEKKYETSKNIIDEQLRAKAKQVESMIKEQAPEVADVLASVEETTIQEQIPVVEDSNALESPIHEVTVEKEELTSIQDEEVLRKFSLYETKMNSYRKFGKISLTKNDSFIKFYESLSLGNSLENIKPAFTLRDYMKFLYFCFVKEVEKLKGDLETLYPVSEIEDYTELLKSEIDAPSIYLNQLEILLIQERQEREQLNDDEHLVLPDAEEKPCKLIFYGKNNGADILKDIKKFTPEKMQDLVDILSKIEDGRIDKYMVINKNVPVLFRAIRGNYIFVSFRVLSNGHILVVSANNLDDLNSTLNKLSSYDTDIENDIARMIRDGSYEYVRLMEENARTKNTIYSQGFGKGI